MPTINTTNRFIAVISSGRSGSSAVAGSLHHAGIPFGLPGHLIGPAEGNPRGHFEDACFNKITGGMLGAQNLLSSQHWFSTYAETVKTHIQRPIWGIKDPAFCAIWLQVEHLFGDDIRIIAVHRQFNSVVRSRMHAQGMTKKYAERFHTWTLALMHQTLYRTKHPVIHVQYEDLVENPESATTAMLDFCTEGLEIVTDQWKAAGFINPEFKKF